MPPGCARPASSMAAPRSATRPTASSKAIAPAATSAAYSPSEWPAAATTSSGPTSAASSSPSPRRQASHAATEQRKSAGCCARVPSPRRSNGSNPRISRPRSKIGMAAVRRVHPLGVAPLTGEEQCAGRHRGQCTPSRAGGFGGSTRAGGGVECDVGSLEVVEGPVAAVPGGEPGGALDGLRGDDGHAAGELGGERRVDVQALPADRRARGPRAGTAAGSGRARPPAARPPHGRCRSARRASPGRSAPPRPPRPGGR